MIGAVLEYYMYILQNGPEERIFYHYQLVDWNDKSATPPSPPDFINFVREVEVKAREDFEDGKILVHCVYVFRISSEFFPIFTELSRSLPKCLPTLRDFFRSQLNSCYLNASVIVKRNYSRISISRS